MEGWHLETRHGRVEMRGRTALMGVLNVTPDSFSDGGKYLDPEKAVAHGVRLAEEGADVIDVGGESTRPGARQIPVEEESQRVIPVIRGLRRVLSIPISIDTCKAEMARRALDEGADIINDVSALRMDPAMVSLAAAERVPVVLMHMQGTPETMQKAPRYGNVVQEVEEFLRSRLQFALENGLDPSRILVDPGIGFGKDLDHNLTLLRSLPALASLGQPLLVGVSRKAFIGKLLGVDPEERVEGSLAAAVMAVAGGAHMIRAHDVKESSRALRIADAVRYGTMKISGENGEKFGA
jgi:dihydropteroate synthase